MNVILCPHCGTSNRAGSNFCNRCGANLQSDEPGDDQGVAPDAQQSPPEETLPPMPPTEAEDPVAQTPDPFTQRRRQLESPSSSAAEPAMAEDWPPLPDDVEPTPPTTRRLVAGVQGLLDPVQIASELNEGSEAVAPPVATPLTLQAEQLRRIRALLTDDPVLLDPPAVALAAPVHWHLPWLVLLISSALALPILFNFLGPVGTPHQWPGVAEAHAVIEQLPSDATVLVVWEYDAATAAELDLVALPLASHLLERRIQPMIVSQLPGGPALAERLFQRAAEGLRADTTFRFVVDRELYVNAGYLPGGAAALTFVAQAPADALTRHSPLAPAVGSRADTTAVQPALTLVVAAQAESVQAWLEQGQPVQQRPTLAFTSAGADPLLRPYLASGQLRGLVSGFDGAASYQRLRTVHLAAGEEDWFQRQLVLQNWGHVALLLVLVLGNLAAWSGGGARG
ncbi:MAG: zinc-ribbon domain-containing protein [Caldilinea sp. CFX5]|nr:zinc-ribbon domain-containing protein [Caldilinea sp. CFX5]